MALEIVRYSLVGPKKNKKVKFLNLALETRRRPDRGLEDGTLDSVLGSEITISKRDACGTFQL